jgi:hypothetical protein
MEWQRCIAHAGAAPIRPASSAVPMGGAITSWKCSAKQEAQAAGRDEDGHTGWGAAEGLSVVGRDVQCSSEAAAVSSPRRSQSPPEAADWQQTTKNEQRAATREKAEAASRRRAGWPRRRTRVGSASQQCTRAAEARAGQLIDMISTPKNTSLAR